MIINGNIKGKYVTIRTVEEKDAEDTLKMRLNKEKTKFLHPVDNDLDKQKNWIRNVRIKQNDYFFVIVNCRNEIIGTVGIYDIEKKKAHIGRLLIYGNALENIEAYLLAIKYGFDSLGIDEYWGDTDINNTSAIKYTKLFGFTYDPPVYDEELSREVCYCNLNKESFKKAEQKISKMIYR